jgi:hypothetical protein
VAFAGSIGRAGPTLSIDCGALRATYQGLGATFVHRGAVVIADAPVARVGPGGALHLGARMDGARVRPAYRDPRSLLRDRPPVAGPLGRAPRDGGVRRRERRGPPGSAPEPSFAPGPEPAPRPAPARLPSAAPAPAPTPLAAWVGLALLAAAVPVGSVWHWRTARATRAAGTRPPRSLAAERR